MPIINRIAEFQSDMTEWRRDIHARPEAAFEERRTADFVAQQLAAFGLKMHRGLAGTGVVGTLTGRGAANRGKVMALRADIDALPMSEHNEVAYNRPTTAIPPCCSARATSPRRGISTGPCNSFSSLPKRPKAAAG
jgi:metal-dependent amidase/aminoacylase/carboxypeptidase family protein